MSTEKIRVTIEIDAAPDYLDRLVARVGRERVAFPRQGFALSSQRRELKILATQVVAAAVRDAWAEPLVYDDIDGSVYVVSPANPDEVRVTRHKRGQTRGAVEFMARSDSHDAEPWRYVADVWGSRSAIGAVCEALYRFGRGEVARVCTRCKYPCRVAVEPDGAWTCPNPGCRHRHEP